MKRWLIDWPRALIEASFIDYELIWVLLISLTACCLLCFDFVLCVGMFSCSSSSSFILDQVWQGPQWTDRHAHRHAHKHLLEALMSADWFHWGPIKTHAESMSILISLYISTLMSVLISILISTCGSWRSCHLVHVPWPLGLGEYPFGQMDRAHAL